MSNIIAFQKKQKPKSVQEDITNSVLQLLLDKADSLICHLKTII